MGNLVSLVARCDAATGRIRSHALHGAGRPCCLRRRAGLGRERLARSRHHARPRPRAGRAERHHRAHRRRRADPQARSAGGRRRTAGCRWQSCGWTGRAHGGRRLHADGHTLRPRGRRGAEQSLPYRTIDDFSMISLLTEYPFVVVTYADHPIRTFPDLIDLARTRPYRCCSAVPATARRTSCRRAPCQDRQRHVPARALSRQRAGDHRSDRQAHRLHRRLPDRGARIHPCRQIAGACGDERGALLQPARGGLRRPRPASRGRLHLVAGAGGARGLAAGGGQPGRIPRSPRSWRSRRPSSGSNWWATSQAPAALKPSGTASPPISTSGPRWSTPPGSSGSEPARDCVGPTTSSS